jgi:hypothetical protein
LKPLGYPPRAIPTSGYASEDIKHEERKAKKEKSTVYERLGGQYGHNLVLRGLRRDKAYIDFKLQPRANLEASFDFKFPTGCRIIRVPTDIQKKKKTA